MSSGYLVMKQAKLQLVPKPETTNAFLISAGIRKPAYTLHHYYETRPTRTKEGARIWEHLYKCIRTGAVRRWGIEEREGASQDELDELMGN